MSQNSDSSSNAKSSWHYTHSAYSKKDKQDLDAAQEALDDSKAIPIQQKAHL